MREALAKSQQSEREMQAAISATQKRLRKQEKLLRESENLKATLLSTVDRQKGQLNEARAEISSLMAYNAGLTVQASSVHDDSQSAEQERIRKASLLEAARLQHKDLLIAQQKLSVQEKELSSLRESTAPSLIMTLQADLAKARAELSRSNASISRLQSDIRRLDSEKSQKDSLLSPLEAELTRRQSYAGDLAGELVKAKEVLTGLEAENSKLKEEVLRTQSQQWEASELEGQLQYLQSELRRVRDEFEAEQLVGARARRSAEDAASKADAWIAEERKSKDAALLESEELKKQLAIAMRQKGVIERERDELRVELDLRSQCTDEKDTELLEYERNSAAVLRLNDKLSDQSADALALRKELEALRSTSTFEHSRNDGPNLDSQLFAEIASVTKDLRGFAVSHDILCPSSSGGAPLPVLKTTVRAIIEAFDASAYRSSGPGGSNVSCLDDFSFDHLNAIADAKALLVQRALLGVDVVLLKAEYMRLTVPTEYHAGGKSEKLRTEMRAKDDVIANLQRALRDQAMATAKSEIELTRIRNGGGEGCKDEVERVRAALKARLSSWNEIEKEVADRCGVVKDLLSAFESVRMEVNDRQKDNERLWAAVEGLVGGIQMRAAEMRVDGATISLAEVVKQRDDALALADFFQRESEAAASLRAFSRQQTLRRPDATTPVSSAANSGASPESVRSPKELVRALESLESRRQSENARSAATIAALTLRIDEMDGGIEGAAVLENKLADLSKDLAFSKGTLQSRIRALEKVTHAAETDAAATANTVRILKEQLREKDRVIDTLRAHVDAFHQSRPSLVYEEEATSRAPLGDTSGIHEELHAQHEWMQVQLQALADDCGTVRPVEMMRNASEASVRECVAGRYRGLRDWIATTKRELEAMRRGVDELAGVLNGVLQRWSAARHGADGVAEFAEASTCELIRGVRLVADIQRGLAQAAREQSDSGGLPAAVGGACGGLQDVMRSLSDIAQLPASEVGPAAHKAQLHVSAAMTCLKNVLVGVQGRGNEERRTTVRELAEKSIPGLNEAEEVVQALETAAERCSGEQLRAVSVQACDSIAGVMQRLGEVRDISSQMDGEPCTSTVSGFVAASSSSLDSLISDLRAILRHLSPSAYLPSPDIRQLITTARPHFASAVRTVATLRLHSQTLLSTAPTGCRALSNVGIEVQRLLQALQRFTRAVNGTPEVVREAAAEAYVGIEAGLAVLSAPGVSARNEDEAAWLPFVPRIDGLTADIRSVLEGFAGLLEQSGTADLREALRERCSCVMHCVKALRAISDDLSVAFTEDVLDSTLQPLLDSMREVLNSHSTAAYLPASEVISAVAEGKRTVETASRFLLSMEQSVARALEKRPTRARVSGEGWPRSLGTEELGVEEGRARKVLELAFLGDRLEMMAGSRAGLAKVAAGMFDEVLTATDQWNTIKSELWSFVTANVVKDENATRTALCQARDYELLELKLRSLSPSRTRRVSSVKKGRSSFSSDLETSPVEVVPCWGDRNVSGSPFSASWPSAGRSIEKSVGPAARLADRLGGASAFSSLPLEHSSLASLSDYSFPSHGTARLAQLPCTLARRQHSCHDAPHALPAPTLPSNLRSEDRAFSSGSQSDQLSQSPFPTADNEESGLPFNDPPNPYNPPHSLKHVGTVRRRAYAEIESEAPSAQSPLQQHHRQQEASSQYYPSSFVSQP
ncbi:hypothetical protein DIPPA_05696 [Diplonema papillatum]|nr:hypothetical protein DIPPA_05696 [Diplonema papillatum]